MTDDPSPLLTRRAALYVVLAYLASWGVGGTFLALGGEWNTDVVTPVAVAYMFGPAVAAVAVQRGVSRRPIRELGLPLAVDHWFLAAWLLPLVLAFAALGASLFVPGVSLDLSLEGFFDRLPLAPEQTEALRARISDLPVHPFWLALGQDMVTGATVNAVIGLGEELGWRGLLYRETRSLGFWHSSALVGVVWGCGTHLSTRGARTGLLAGVL